MLPQCFDAMTGQPLQPRFDAITDQPLQAASNAPAHSTHSNPGAGAGNDAPGADNAAPRFDAMTGQHTIPNAVAVVAGDDFTKVD